MFKAIFGKDDYTPDNTQYSQYKLLNGYDNYFSPWDGNSYDDATVRTCIDAIARHAGKLKPKHIRRQNGKVVETGSNLDTLLSIRPNEFMSTYDFIYKVISQLYSYNNAFVYVQIDITGNIIGLYPLNYGDVELKEYQGVLYCRFNFLQAGRITVPYTEIIHLRRHFNRGDFFGESNEKPLRFLLNIFNTVKKALENAVKNCMKLRGYVKFLGNVRPEDQEEQLKVFTSKFVDAVNGTGTGIAAIDQKAEYHELKADIQTADRGQMNHCREDIYRYFGLHEKIITGNYTEEEWNAFYESVIEPIAVQMSLEFTAKLFTEREKGHGNEAIFTTNRLQYASMKSKVTMVNVLLPQGGLSINEVREIFGFAAVPDGDKRQVSLNYVNSAKQDKYQLGEEDTVKKGDNNNEQNDE